jgi:DNA polymerase I-like protein with 3'-5' exonuclease and polymerase domains
MTNYSGHNKWRGSRISLPKTPWTVLPTLHPRTLVVNPSQTHVLQIDLSRAKAIYEGTQTPRAYSFIIEPSFNQVIGALQSLLERAENTLEGNFLKISGDIETRAGHTACLGIAWSAEEAICIPLITTNDEKPFYWTEEEETFIIALVAQLFMHPRVLSVGQNYLYDCQYYYRHWGFLPSNVRDTMIGHHAIFSNMRKGLDFLSAMYAQDHVYWKDEIKEWDPTIGEKQYWTYNCKDACITFEIDEEIYNSAEHKGVLPHYEFQQSLFFPVIRMMNRGIRFDVTQRAALRNELTAAGIDRQEKLEYITGHPVNPKSPVQLKKLFYDDLGIPGIKNLLGDGLTTNSPAMALIAEREPMLKPLCQLIVELRSVGVFLSTFVEAQLDTDERMRCSFSIAGPTTYRFSSSENAFYSGMNLQNIPVAEKQKIKDKNYIHLPNIRKLFIPDQGYTFFDMDLDRADLQVVVWEAEDENMKKALREGLDMHCVNACDIFDIKGIPYDELEESHRNYKDHRARIGESNRGKAKAGVHATNYGVGDRKLAQALGITVLDASRFRAKWFAAHPGIRRWHLRTEESATKRGFVENRFGARLYNLGRINLPELLGWLPQSTVAGVINRALFNIDAAEQRGETSIQLQIQVHDSLAGQFLTSRRDEEIENLKRLSQIVIPYEDPLIIPVGINCSTQSWGHCK